MCLALPFREAFGEVFKGRSVVQAAYHSHNPILLNDQCSLTCSGDLKPEFQLWKHFSSSKLVLLMFIRSILYSNPDRWRVCLSGRRYSHTYFNLQTGSWSFLIWILSTRETKASLLLKHQITTGVWSEMSCSIYKWEWCLSKPPVGHCHFKHLHSNVKLIFCDFKCHHICQCFTKIRQQYCQLLGTRLAFESVSQPRELDATDFASFLTVQYSHSTLYPL